MTDRGKGGKKVKERALNKSILDILHVLVSQQENAMKRSKICAKFLKNRSTKWLEIRYLRRIFCIIFIFVKIL